MRIITYVLSSFVIVSFISSPAFAQWAMAYGGSNLDAANSIQQTKDGGYIVAGVTTSFYAERHDICVLKLNSDGTIAWQKNYGGGDIDSANSIQQTKDGGYIVAGSTESFGAGGYDIWVLKLHTDGGVAWQKTYGRSGDDFVHSIQQTQDGGYIVAGTTDSFGAGGKNIWILRLNADGSVYGDGRAIAIYYSKNNDDHVHSIQQTADGGYIMVGWTTSFGKDAADILVLKLNSALLGEWRRTYSRWHNDDDNDDKAYSIQQTQDGGYIVAGVTESFGAGGYDIWILKLDADGVAWQKTYGGGLNRSHRAFSIQQTKDGGYIVAGDTFSTTPKGYDICVLKLNSDGTVAWQKTYGGGSYDVAHSIQQTQDGGYIVAGETGLAGAGYIIQISGY